MIRIRIAATAVAATLALAVGLSAPVDAGTVSTEVKMLVARKANGPFKESLGNNLPDGGVKTAYLKVRAIGGNTEDVFLLDPNDADDISIKYFTKSGDNITADVTDEGFHYTVKPGKPKLFRTRVIVNGPAPPSNCLFVYTWDENPSHFTRVQLRVNAPACA